MTPQEFGEQLKNVVRQRWPVLSDSIANIIVLHASMLVITSQAIVSAAQMGLTTHQRALTVLAEGQLTVDKLIAQSINLDTDKYLDIMEFAAREVEKFMKSTTREGQYGSDERTVH